MLNTTEVRNKNKYISDCINDYTVVDIETTGLSSRYHEIIEISALKVRNNIIVDKFSSLIKPSRSIPSIISELTGITNTMLFYAPKIEKVLPEFIEFAGDDVILGHNINFDIKFIQENYLRYFNRYFTNDYADTCKLARKYCNTPDHKLKTLAQYYNISTEGHHRALKDCEITFEVYNKIRENIS